jgi:nucleoside-diphosphate-sugar epimerase
MRVAIFGATSEIACDFTALMLEHAEHELFLYARRPQMVRDWLDSIGKADAAQVHSFDDFLSAGEVDALINFVAIGNPAKVSAAGAAILEVTQAYDDLALAYIRKHPHCRYIFLSSGAVYGLGFEQAATAKSVAQVRINALQPEDWYAIAKLYAECRHRAMSALAIVDVRVFNYFSHTQDMRASYLMADVVRTIGSGKTLQTSNVNIERDYLHPIDFNRLLNGILNAPPTNTAVDCYSRAPIDKFSLLDAMQARFGLQYEVVDRTLVAGHKLKYYSLNRFAEHFGYHPSMSSLDGILLESDKLLGKCMK